MKRLLLAAFQLGLLGDVLFLAGLAVLLHGLAMIYRPLPWIVGGAGLIAAARPWLRRRSR